MDFSASDMNDPNKEQYTFTVMLPYLKMALKELREYFELNNVPVTNERSAIITVPSGTTVISRTSDPALPEGLVSIQTLYTSQEGVENWVEVKPRDFLPPNLTNVTYYSAWAWMRNEIRLPLSIVDIDIKLDYIKQIFTDIEDEYSEIDVINADTFLHFRTAALVAEFVAEDTPRADKLNIAAGAGLDRVTGIETKARQAMPVRRRPFRSNYRLRGVR